MIFFHDMSGYVLLVLDVATIFALNVFRLPVSLQVAIEFVLSFKFFGTLITRKLFFFRMGLLVHGGGPNFSWVLIYHKSCRASCPFLKNRMNQLIFDKTISFI